MTRCAVCIGAGGWDPSTFQPAREADAIASRREWVCCPMCRGTGSYLATVAPGGWK